MVNRLFLFCLVVLSLAGASLRGEFPGLEGVFYDVPDSSSLARALLTEYRGFLEHARRSFLSGNYRDAAKWLKILKVRLAVDRVGGRPELVAEERKLERLLEHPRRSFKFRSNPFKGATRDSTFLLFPWLGYPGSLDNVNVPRGEYVLLVDKKEQKLHVYRSGGSWHHVKSYKCTTGKRLGDKTRSQDLRTPEGVYRFTRVIEKRDLAPIYGVRAFVLNYPDSMDVRRGKDGGGIWLHGLNRPLVNWDTNGCIGLRNPDILDVSRYIKLASTPIIITDEIHYVGSSPGEYRVASVVDFLMGWKRAWESKDFDSYSAMYSSDFLGGGKAREDFFRRKRRFMTTRKWIKVAISELTIDVFPTYLDLTFLQEYSSPEYSDKGWKRLKLRMESAGWRIYREDWSKTRYR